MLLLHYLNIKEAENYCTNYNVRKELQLPAGAVKAFKVEQKP